jgi:hypothetical protein
MFDGFADFVAARFHLAGLVGVQRQAEKLPPRVIYPNFRAESTCQSCQDRFLPCFKVRRRLSPGAVMNENGETLETS